MPDLRNQRLELILQQLEELPTLPAVAVRVLQATQDENSNTADVVRLIGSDPALTARILQLTRRADKGVSDSVQTIDRAVTLLGFDAVRNAVLAISIFQTLGTGTPAAHPIHLCDEDDGTTPATFDREGFWMHSLAVACCAELLAEAAPTLLGVPPSTAFLCGLLHDLGKLALDVALPKSYGRVVEAAELLHGNIADLERTIIGIDHTVAGKRVAERWQLPAMVRDVAWLHGQPPEALPAIVEAAAVNLVTLADQLVRRQHLGYSGNYAYAVSQDALLTATGLEPEDIDRVLVALVDRMEPRSAALGLGQATSEALYRQALAQADREIRRVSVQLDARTRRLTQRTAFFEAMDQFQAELRSDASLQQTLATIARVAAGVLGLERVAAFSISTAQPLAEAVLFDAESHQPEFMLLELPSIDGPAGAGAASGRLTPDDVPPPEPGYPVFHKSRGPSANNPEAHADFVPAANHAGLRVRLPVPAAGASPVNEAGDEVEWLTAALGPRLQGERCFWIALSADRTCQGGVIWGASAGEANRLAGQKQELTALAHAWMLALRTAQVRDEARTLSEELAEANRRLHTAQNAALRTQSLTCVGEMAAGAAHEMNNPLAVISGRSQLLAQLIEDEKQRGMAKLVYEQADRLSAIITEMMAFAKPQPPAVEACKVDRLIEEGIARAKAMADPADRVFEVVVGKTPDVAADRNQIPDALAEIIANAVQATDPKTGKIVIRVGHDVWSDRIVVNITDTGTGMDQATLERAFDPFFSAKKAGRRRGLGLARAIRWIEAGGGTMKLESEPDHGTRATILLAVAGESARETDITRANRPASESVGSAGATSAK